MEEKELTQAFKDLTEAVASLLENNTSASKEQRGNINKLEQIWTDLSDLQQRLSTSEASIRAATSALPQQIELKIRHRFEGRTGVFSILFLASLIISSVSIGGWMASRKEQNRLQESDLKYRYMILHAPAMTIKTDTEFTMDPLAFEKKVKRLEQEKRIMEQAEALAKEKEGEARKARENAERLKSKSP